MAEGHEDGDRFFDERARKIADIEALGYPMFRPVDDPPHLLHEAKSALRAFEAGRAVFPDESHGETGEHVRVSGRVMQIRDQGKSCFLVVEDLTDRLQLWLKLDIAGEKAFALLKLLDIGDIVVASGPMMRTRRGEPTLLVHEIMPVVKSLRPLPEKFHGLSNKEVKYRKRYLDLVSDADVRHRFSLRSRVVQTIRSFLFANGFLEMETPILQAIPGGGEARPFTTYWNALHSDVYLRIATELHLKRLMVGGFDRVFELGRVFRNEGVDPRHNPEFTTLEVYATYWNYTDMMRLVEELIVLSASVAWPLSREEPWFSELVRNWIDRAEQRCSAVCESIENVEEVGHADLRLAESDAKELVACFEGALEAMADYDTPDRHHSTALDTLAELRTVAVKIHAGTFKLLEERVTTPVASVGVHVSVARVSAVKALATDLLARLHALQSLPQSELHMRKTSDGTGMIDISPPFRRAKMVDLVAEACGFDPLAEWGNLASRAAAHGIEVPAGAGEGAILFLLYDALVEPALVDPTFVTHYPTEVSPLALHSAEDPRFTDRFELVINGREIANAFSELNDPREQRARFEDQARKREQGDEEAHMFDEDFVEALEVGMPPAAGMGVGIDRLVMLLNEAPAIRDVLLFPMMRQQAAQDHEDAGPAE